jgi:hypothetical protein
MKNFILAFAALFIALPLTITDTAKAQWGIAAAYESRSEDPQNGFGLRIEREILSGLPLLEVGLRAHFSYFSEENRLTTGGITYSRELESFDYGIAAYSGINLAFIKPYAGLGLGSDNSKGTFEDDGLGGIGVPTNFDENNIYWNIFAGVQLSPVPIIKPFIEYRFTRLMDAEELDYKQNGRFAIGVKLSF